MITIQTILDTISQYQQIDISSLNKELTIDEIQGYIAPEIPTNHFLMENISSIIYLKENEDYLKNLPEYKGFKLTVLYDQYVGTLASNGKIFGCYQALNIKSPHYWFRKINQPEIEEITEILKEEIDKDPLAPFLHYMPFQVLDNSHPIFKETLATLPEQVESLEFDKQIMSQHTIVILQQAIVNELLYYNILAGK